MRKLAIVIVAALICSCVLAACAGKTVSGNVESVVKQCQQIGNNENVTVSVTGSTTGSYDPSNGTLMLVDGSSYTYSVMAHLKDRESGKKAFGRVTVKGKLENKLTSEHIVNITDAEIVG